MAVAIGEKHGGRDVVFLGESTQERCGGIHPRRLNSAISNGSFVSTSIAA